MADDLIPILSRAVGEESHGVDARTLHATLGNRDHFSTWIGDRIAQLGLVQSIDWESFSESSEKGGRPRIEYILTLDAAKHVAMVEKTAKGAELRAYFIAAEKRLREVVASPVAMLADPAVLRTLLASYAERVETAEAKIAADAPKVEVFDRIIDCGDSEGFRSAAKLIFAATGANENEVRALMLKREWIRRLDGRLMPAHTGTMRGYVTTRDREWSDNEGGQHVKAELRITQKGIARAIELFLKAESA